MSNARLSPLFNWRGAVASEHGPESATTRHVLLSLSLYMSQKGDSCFPSLSTLATDTGLDKSTVSKHLKKAHEAGWIDKRPSYDEEGNRIGTEYFTTTPPGVDDDQRGVDEHQRGVDDDQPNTSCNTGSNSSARARESEAVKAYEDTFPRTPNQIQAEEITAKVGDLDLWRAVMRWWAANGYDSSSVGRMLNKLRQIDSAEDLYRNAPSGDGAPTSDPDPTTNQRFPTYN